MRITIARLAFAVALPFAFAAPAAAEDASTALTRMCVASGESQAACECQVAAIIANVDPRAVQVLVASEAAQSAATPEEAKKIVDDALKAAGITEAEFQKLMEEGSAKAQPAMEACPK